MNKYKAYLLLSMVSRIALMITMTVVINMVVPYTGYLVLSLGLFAALTDKLASAAEVEYCTKAISEIANSNSDRS